MLLCFRCQLQAPARRSADDCRGDTRRDCRAPCERTPLRLRMGTGYCAGITVLKPRAAYRWAKREGDGAAPDMFCPPRFDSGAVDRAGPELRKAQTAVGNIVFLHGDAFEAPTRTPVRTPHAYRPHRRGANAARPHRPAGNRRPTPQPGRKVGSVVPISDNRLSRTSVLPCRGRRRSTTKRAIREPDRESAQMCVTIRGSPSISINRKKFLLSHGAAGLTAPRSDRP